MKIKMKKCVGVGVWVWAMWGKVEKEKRNGMFWNEEEKYKLPSSVKKKEEKYKEKSKVKIGRSKEYVCGREKKRKNIYINV